MSKEEYVCTTINDEYGDPVVHIGHETLLDSGLIICSAIASAMYADLPEIRTPTTIDLPSWTARGAVDRMKGKSPEPSRALLELAHGAKRDRNSMKAYLTHFAVTAYQNDRKPIVVTHAILSDQDDMLLRDARINTQIENSKLNGDLPTGLYL